MFTSIFVSKRKMKTICTPLAGLIVFLGLVLAGCGGEDSGNGARQQNFGSMGNGADQMSAAIPVQVAPVKRGDISLYLLQTTTIEPIRQVDIVAKVAGHVVELLVEEGDLPSSTSGRLLCRCWCGPCFSPTRLCSSPARPPDRTTWDWPNCTPADRGGCGLCPRRTAKCWRTTNLRPSKNLPRGSQLHPEVDRRKGNRSLC